MELGSTTTLGHGIQGKGVLYSQEIDSKMLGEFTNLDRLISSSSSPKTSPSNTFYGNFNNGKEMLFEDGENTVKMKVNVIKKSPITSRIRGKYLSNIPKLTNEMIVSSISKEPIETVINNKNNLELRGDSIAYMIHEDLSDTNLNFVNNPLDS